MVLQCYGATGVGCVTIGTAIIRRGEVVAAVLIYGADGAMVAAVLIYAWE